MNTDHFVVVAQPGMTNKVLDLITLLFGGFEVKYEETWHEGGRICHTIRVLPHGETVGIQVSEVVNGQPTGKASFRHFAVSSSSIAHTVAKITKWLETQVLPFSTEPAGDNMFIVVPGLLEDGIEITPTRH